MVPKSKDPTTGFGKCRLDVPTILIEGVTSLVPLALSNLVAAGEAESWIWPFGGRAARARGRSRSQELHVTIILLRFLQANMARSKRLTVRLYFRSIDVQP